MKIVKQLFILIITDKYFYIVKYVTYGQLLLLTIKYLRQEIINIYFIK